MVEPGSEQSRPFSRSDTGNKNTKEVQAVLRLQGKLGRTKKQLTEGSRAVVTRATVSLSHCCTAEHGWPVS